MKALTKEESDARFDHVYSLVKYAKTRKELISNVIAKYAHDNKLTREMSAEISIEVKAKLDSMKEEIARLYNKDVNKLFLIQLTFILLTDPYSLIKKG